MSTLQKDFTIPGVACTSQEDQENMTLKVTLLSSEWKSSTNGDLSTINRELAIQLAKHPNVDVSVLLPNCSEADRSSAESHNVKLVEADRVPGFEPVLCLSFPPRDHTIDCVIGHGVHLGRPIASMKRNPDYSHCKWIQVVHSAPEEDGMYKDISEGQKMQETEIQLCKMADQVITIGPELAEAYKCYLCPAKQEEKVFDLTPSIFSEFLAVEQATKQRRTFRILVIGSGDSCEDFNVKGYDIAAKAIAELKDESYKLKFVCAAGGKGDIVAENLLHHGISRNQLIVCSFDDTREVLANLFCEVDLAIMPSRTEGFGTTALEALSAGLPVLVSGNSGLGEALKKVPLGSQSVVDSEDPKEWAREIKRVHQKERDVRLAESRLLREKYLEKYSWEEPCKSLVIKMKNLVFGKALHSSLDCEETERNKQGESMPEEAPNTSLQRRRTLGNEQTKSVQESGGHVADPDYEDHLLKLKIMAKELNDEQEKELSDELIHYATTYFKNNKVSSCFFSVLQDCYNLVMKTYGVGCLEITVQCRTLDSLQLLWRDFLSGHLDKLAEEYLVSSTIKTKLDVDIVKFKVTIKKEDYSACKTSFLQHSEKASNASLKGKKTDGNEQTKFSRESGGQVAEARYLRQEVREKAQDIKDMLGGKVDSAAQEVQRLGQEVRDEAQDIKDELGGKVESAVQYFVQCLGQELGRPDSSAGVTAMTLLTSPDPHSRLETSGTLVTDSQEEAPNTTLKSNTPDGKEQTKSVREGSIPADDDNKQQNFQGEKVLESAIYSCSLSGQIADQRKVQLAHERVLKDGYVTVYRSRIILIGQDRAGKTSLKKSLIGLPFDSEEQRTEGIEVDPLKCEIDVDQAARNWQSIDFEEGSFDGKKYGRKEPKRRELKSGLFKEEFYQMDIWDFAGQQLYYASHPIFLPQRALYILVHNLSKPLDSAAEPCMRQGSNDVKLENPNNETNMENLLSWLATVHSVALATDDPDDDTQHRLPYLRPPVFIVGTHADKPVEDIAIIKKQIQERISGMKYEKHVVRPLFCIDNTQRPNFIKKFIQKFQKLRGKHKTAEEEGKADGIKELQNKLLDVLRQEPYMGEKIPVRWFLFEKVIEALVAKQIYHRNLQQLEHYAKKDCFMKDAKEFESMISFYHGLGMIIKHRNTVVLKAQWLIDLFKQLITIPPFNKQNAQYANYWRELEGSGILSMEHVDYVFSSFIGPGIIREDILDMMEQFGLIAKFSVSPNDEKYFVPAQLKSSPVELCKMEPSSTDPCPLYLLFVHGFVPHGLFLQLVSRSIHWCSKTWATHQPTLYQNGAWFIIGKDIHDFVLICKTGFVKVILRKKAQSHQVVGQNPVKLATLVREFLEDTLKNLSQEMPYLRGLQYRLCVACPNCHQGTEEMRRACSDHMKTTCTHKDCLHLIDANEGQPDICKRKPWDMIETVCGLKKWFLKRRSQGLSSSNVAARSHDKASEINPMKSATALKVTLLGSEWSSSMGGLSTINRQLAILLAKHSEVDVTLLVPQFACSDDERRMASSHNVSIQEAEKLAGFSDPLEWLSFPPRDLDIDFVLGHGAKLGKQAQVIRKYHSCKWIQVVHTAPEELGMFKDCPMAISKGEDKRTTEVELCKLADAVVAVGPKLRKAYSSYLRSCDKHQDIIQLTPSTFIEFSDVKQAADDMDNFKVLTFGRGDPEDFSLKGYDISARAIVELKDRSYHLTFVGAPDGKQDEVAKKLLKSGIDKKQLAVNKFVQSKERLKELFCEVDLCIMPSRTEGFGLTALEALSAGLPILVSGNSGFGEALCTVPSGKSFVVESEDPQEWAKAIAGVRQKERSDRLQDIQQLRRSYEEKFSWEKQCDSLVEKMWDIVHASKRQDTSFRAQQVKVVDTSTEQLTVDSLLTPSFLEQIIQELQQMQLDASKVKSRTDLSLGLRNIASDRGFRISDNQGLGNCMFHALSEQLEIVKGIKIPHGELRQNLVQYLRGNPKLPDGTDLFDFVHGHQTWTEYLVHMEQDGAWGDHVILCAAANYFETCIRVVSSLSHSNDVIITPHCPVDESKPLVLGHIHEMHYVSLQPVQGNWGLLSDWLGATLKSWCSIG